MDASNARWAATMRDGVVAVVRRGGPRSTVARVGGGVVRPRLFARRASEWCCRMVGALLSEAA